MDDTSAHISEKMQQMFRSKTPIERLTMGCSMYDFSKYLVTSAILREHPNISKAAMRREIFLRFYGDEFSIIEREKIIKHLEDHT